MKTLLYCAVLVPVLLVRTYTPLRSYEPPQKQGKAARQPTAPSVVAYVIDVKPTVRLLRGSQPARELTIKNNRGTPLLADDKLQFDTNGEITLRYYTAAEKPETHDKEQKTHDKETLTRTFKGAGGTYTIKWPSPKPPTWASGIADRMGHIGGGDLAGGTLLIAPAKDSIMRTAHFTVRWKVPTSPQTMSLQVLTDVSQDAWRSGDIAAETGGLPAKELQALRTQLKTWATSKDRLKIQVLLLTSSHDADTAGCILMSGAEEKRLAEDLNRWRALETDPLLYQMGAAQIISGYGLRNEAADAWDAALALAPDSQFVLEKTLDAHRQINDTAAVEKLKQRIP